MSMCRWKNDLDCEIIGSKGSLKMNLYANGDHLFIFAKRVLPSGRQKEKKLRLKKKRSNMGFRTKIF